MIGASNTPGKWGHMMVEWPIQSGYRGFVFPVNPRDKTVLGLKLNAILADLRGNAV